MTKLNSINVERQIILESSFNGEEFLLICQAGFRTLTMYKFNNARGEGNWLGEVGLNFEKVYFEMSALSDKRTLVFGYL